MICNESKQQGEGVVIVRIGCAHVRIVKYLDDCNHTHVGIYTVNPNLSDAEQAL